MASKAGRRGTKRKAEAPLKEEKPAVEVEEKEERGNGEDGQRVVIEHCKS
ncbi:selenoprotein H-like [Scomber scombrus]|uniref:Selenoprotein H-like n=1 Tax=Scomber scombrus TaxID=13677 RepID=A0AAV1PKT2_SCOSC